MSSSSSSNSVRKSQIHYSLEKLNRERMKFQNLAMVSPSDCPPPSLGTLQEELPSPMTELAHNFSDVAHILSPANDYRRRLSLDSCSPATPLSTITNIVAPKRALLDPKKPLLTSFGGPHNKENVVCKPPSPLASKIPKPFLEDEENFDECSLDSGLGGSVSKGRGFLSLSESLCSDAVASINRTTADLRSRAETEPLTSLPEVDSSPERPDGFDLLDDFDLDGGQQDDDPLSTNVSTLITNRILSESSFKGVDTVINEPSSRKKKPPLMPFRNSGRFRRCLSLMNEGTSTPIHPLSSMNASFDSPVSRPSPALLPFKRPCSPGLTREDSGESQFIKRRKMSGRIQFEQESSCPPSGSAKKFNRSMSEVSFSEIMKAGLAPGKNCTGDLSRPLALPLVQGAKHHDLRPISAETVSDLMAGKYSDVISSFRIIDARYVYEFEGGHIAGAENFGSWDEGKFFEEFLPQTLGPLPLTSMDENRKRDIVVFHCEFSSLRGPELMKKLRAKDRTLNRDSYPCLHYPETYLLHNGYKEFFEKFPELCEPRGYRTMIDPQFTEQEKYFHKRSKSWAGGTVSRTGTRSARSLNR